MLQTEKKSNPTQLIGFLLLGGLFMAYLFISNQKRQKAEELNKSNEVAIVDSLQEESNVADMPKDTISLGSDSVNQSSVAIAGLQKISKSNEHLNLNFTNKGAQLEQLELKNYKKYDPTTKEHSAPLYLVDSGSIFNVKFKTQSGKEYNTKDLLFSASETQNDSLQIITYSTPLEGGSLSFIYSISPDYQVDLAIHSEGIPITGKARMEVHEKTYQMEKGRRQEMYYTDLHYGFDNYEDNSYEAKHLEENEETINWFCIKQQFFLSILEAKEGFRNSLGQVSTIEMPNGMENPHLKNFEISADLNNSSDLNQQLTWYFLPMNMDLLGQNKYADKGFDDLVPFDYFNSGFIGWLNKHFFYNIYNIMHQWGLASGWVILLMTIIVKLLMSPIMYRQHKSSAMMRAIKPDVEIINEKYKDDPLKRQQETMALQKKAGVNMLSGCIPALLQIPLFMALFRLFPNIIQMRGESFLWANDLTAYDSIYEWPQYIPILSDMYGNHISLFTILYAVVLIIYTRMNSSNIQQPTQEGMPDMRKLMYIMPLLFVFFLNSYAAALTWYYVVSNAINILVILYIKQFLIDEDKIHAMVQENVKNAPKTQKKSRFQKLLDQAAEQQRLQEQQKKKGKKK